MNVQNAVRKGTEQCLANGPLLRLVKENTRPLGPRARFRHHDPYRLASLNVLYGLLNKRWRCGSAKQSAPIGGLL